ncbi:hypothetical protein [Sulfuriflexus mobilis]|uniref:hypothetical protein n=1 Tax=Sulfuriflexus mobilis TaxID=1811807 RepID=UPI000F816D57|nr:hypothetical protein [Sulfuriflexus mobilis]
MEAEILQELETIRVFVFIIMCVVAVWGLVKTIESTQNIVVSFKKAWDTFFENRVVGLIDKGEYQEAISECKNKLKKYPNHVDANWLIAKAYYFTENNELSKVHFEKSIYLVPGWENIASEYIEKINAR